MCRRRPPDAGVGSTNPLRSSEPLVFALHLPLSDLDTSPQSCFNLVLVIGDLVFVARAKRSMLMRGDDACMKVCQSPDVTK